VLSTLYWVASYRLATLLSAPIPPPFGPSPTAPTGPPAPTPFPSPSPSPTVVVNPTGVGAPGRETIQDLLDWLGQYALWACVAAIVAGGGMFAWARRTGAAGMAVTGTALVGGGVVGTILVGLAPDIVNALYTHT
jgi:hypothetical protein